MTKVDLPEKKVTLEECSKNDNGEPVTHLKNKVYCFDTVSEMEAMLYRRKRSYLRQMRYILMNRKKYIFLSLKMCHIIMFRIKVYWKKCMIAS